MSDLLMATYPAGTRLPVSYILKETVGLGWACREGGGMCRWHRRQRHSPGSPYWSGLDLARTPKAMQLA